MHTCPHHTRTPRRKKDHGRAEALLMAAWALGVRMQPINGGNGSGGDAAAAELAAEAESGEE